jgi:hypothetical protein
VRPGGACIVLVRANRQNAHMSHDSSFPDSTEAPDQRSDRALAALQYEEQAGLGFRRRQRSPLGNPYADPERFQVDREPTTGELWAGMLAGIGTVLGFAAIFYHPLMMSTIAVLFVITGSLGDGAPSRVARIGLVVAIVGFVLGMTMSIFVTHKALW